MITARTTVAMHTGLSLALAGWLCCPASVFGTPAKKNSGPTAKQTKEKDDNDDSAADDDKKAVKQAWKYSIPSDSISKNGLPQGKLFYLLRKRQQGALRALLKSCPVKTGDEEERRLWLASCLSQEQRYEEAAALFDQCKTLDQAPNLIRVLAAKAYSEEQKFDRAIDLCTQVISKWEMEDAYKVRAGAYCAADKLKEAAQDYVKLADLNKYSAKTQLVRAGNLLVKVGRSDEALALMERARKERNGADNLPVEMVRANCFKQQGKWQLTIDSLTRSLALIGSDKSPYAKSKQSYYLNVCLKERAQCYQKLGKKALADADLKALNESSKAVEAELIGK